MIFLKKYLRLSRREIIFIILSILSLVICYLSDCSIENTVDNIESKVDNIESKIDDKIDDKKGKTSLDITVKNTIKKGKDNKIKSKTSINISIKENKSKKDTFTRSGCFKIV